MIRRRYLYNPLSSASATHSAAAQAAYPDVAQRVLALLRANPPYTIEWDDWHADTTVAWFEAALPDIPRLTLGAAIHIMEHDGFVFRLWNYCGTETSYAHPYVVDDFRGRIADQANQILLPSPLKPNVLITLISEEVSCSDEIRKIIADYRIEQAGQRKSNRPQRIILGPPPPPRRRIPRQP